MIAMERSGPSPKPVRKAKPISMPSLVPLFLPLSGVMNSPRARPAPARENRSPPPWQTRSSSRSSVFTLRREVKRWT